VKQFEGGCRGHDGSELAPVAASRPRDGAPSPIAEERAEALASGEQRARELCERGEVRGDIGQRLLAIGEEVVDGSLH
jgi:hypothetical protein